MLFVFYYKLQMYLQNKVNDTYLYFRITEASKAFQMEKIVPDYENMSHFTVNLTREEKIIREIDFYRGMLFIWPKLLS